MSNFDRNPYEGESVASEFSPQDIEGQERINMLALNIKRCDPEKDFGEIGRIKYELWTELINEAHVKECEVEIFNTLLDRSLESYDGKRPFANYFITVFSKRRGGARDYIEETSRSDEEEAEEQDGVNIQVGSADRMPGLKMSAQSFGKLITYIILYESGRRELSDSGKRPSQSFQRRRYFHLLFSEEMTDVIKRHPNDESLSFFEDFERDLFKAMEPAFLSRFIEGAFSNEDEQNVIRLYNIPLKTRRCERQVIDPQTGNRKTITANRYNGPILKVNNPQFDPMRRWRLESWVLSDYMRDCYPSFSHGANQISEHRKGYEASKERWVTTVLTGGDIRFEDDEEE